MYILYTHRHSLTDALQSFLCALTGLITGIAHVGGFKHEAVLTPDTLIHVRKLFWAAQPVGLVGSLLPKISIGLQLLYIMPRTQTFRVQKYVVWFCLGAAGIANLLVFPMVFAQCSPTSALWTTDGNCWDTNVDTIYFTIAALVNAFVDFIFVAIPIGIIQHLQISFINKALLVNFLGARMFAFIASVTKASYIAKNGFAANDLTWNAFDYLLWQTAEQFCLCFCGSFPTYKALFDRWLKRRASIKASTGTNGLYSSRPGSSNSAWFYEHKCFERSDTNSLIIQRHIDIEITHERLGSNDDLASHGFPMATSPTTKPEIRVLEARMA